MSKSLEEIIIEQTETFRTDRLTMSFGEIMNIMVNIRKYFFIIYTLFILILECYNKPSIKIS